MISLRKQKNTFLIIIAQRICKINNIMTIFAADKD